MRINRTLSCGELMKDITTPEKNKNIKLSKSNPSIILPTKNDLWNPFKECFYSITDKRLEVNNETINNLKTLFFYFTKDDSFFGCENLRKDISKPRFDKGLLIIGNYGIGKTAYLKAFEKLFRFYTPLRFKGYSSMELVRMYENISSPVEKELFFHNMERKCLYIDDLDAEKNASNFGITNVVKEVLSLRYEKSLLTFASCNYSSSDLCVEQTMESFIERYGNRIYDRMFDMFNVIEFKGKSKRR
ncbi:hypothetical protein [Corallibacter sp.]|uniref:hypothetical protein n=1 Tax=Corallibacter sp. TaxID=2038084 RepID=UPI003AB292C3